MPKKTVREMNSLERMHYSLGAKTFHAVLIMAIVLIIAAVAFGFYLYSNAVGREYKKETWHVSKTAAMVMNDAGGKEKLREILRIYSEVPDSIRGDGKGSVYRQKFESVKDAKYADLRNRLAEIRDDNGMSNVMAVAVNVQMKRMITLIDPGDAGESDEEEPGSFTSVKAVMIKALDSGSKVGIIERFLGEQSTPSYVGKISGQGYRCTSGTKLFEFDDYNVMIISESDMNRVADASRLFLIQYLAILIVITFIIGFLMVQRLKKTLIGPINELASAAEAYSIDKKNGGGSIKHFDSLDIRTGDEIENLAFIMQDMEQDVNDYVTDLTEVTKEKERINTELNVAGKIQEGMIPHIFPVFPERSEFDIIANMTPAKEVGGDFYDMFLVDDDHLVIVMADVSGKGVPAALFMMGSKLMISNSASSDRLSPAAILENVNNGLCDNNVAGMFVTVWLGVLEISTGKLAAANAGHEYPVIAKKDGRFELYKDKHGFVLGGMKGMKYKEYELTLEQGDVLFEYTDGVTEATDGDNAMFGTERMLEALNAEEKRDPDKLIEDVGEAISGFVNDAPQFDDITMLALRYNGTAGIAPEEVKEIEVEAGKERLSEVNSFIDSVLEGTDVNKKAKYQLDLAVEEIFVNIASYAYPDGDGKVNIRAELLGGDKAIRISFSDSGIPYDPLEREDPDVTLPAEEREIGGLGIMLVRKTMDDVSYDYRDGKNIMTIKKIFCKK